MRFLADEHIPLASIRMLREAEHDVVSVAETAPSADDPTVLARARKTDRILLTFDSDFGRLLFVELEPPPAGVVYLRFAQRTPMEAAEIVLQLLANPLVDLPGRYTTVRRDRVRQRRLPAPLG